MESSNVLVKDCVAGTEGHAPRADVQAPALPPHEILHRLADFLARETSVPLPLRNGFLGPYARVVSRELRSWDEAFGRPFSGRGNRGKKARHESRALVYEAVSNCLEVSPGLAVDRRLFETLSCRFKAEGQDLGTASTVERMYYAALQDGMPSVAVLRKLQQKIDAALWIAAKQP